MNTGRRDQARMPTPAELLLARHAHLKLDNTSQSPDEAAGRILARLTARHAG